MPGKDRRPLVWHQAVPEKYLSPAEGLTRDTVAG